MGIESTVRVIGQADWIVVHNGRIVSWHRKRSGARRSAARFGLPANAVQRIPGHLFPAPHLPAVVTREADGVNVHGVFNSPEAANSWAESVGGYISLVLWREGEEKAGVVDVGTTYIVDPPLHDPSQVVE